MRLTKKFKVSTLQRHFYGIQYTNMFSFETRKIRTLSLICLVTLSVFLLVLIGSYYYSNRMLLTYDTEKTLEFVSEVASQAVAMRTKEPLKEMSIMASLATETNSPEDFVRLMIKNDKYNLFADFTWIDPDLTYYTSVDKELDLKMSGTLQKAFQGSSYIAYTENSPVTNAAAILYGVPVVKDGKTKAVLVGSCFPERFTEYAFMDTFDGNGSIYIVNSTGDVVTGFSNAQNTKTFDNLFEFLEMEGNNLFGKTLQEIQEDFKSKQKGTVFCSKGGERTLMHYMPFEIDNWYLLSSVPLNLVMDQHNKHAILFGVIGILVMVTFGVMIMSIINRTGQYKNSLEMALYTDPVTGGMSYTKFEKLARELIQNAEPNTYTFVSLDIHSFKLINDINGGGGGNATLMHMYNVLKKYVEKGELMCRVDADIFNLVVRTRPVEEMEKKLKDFTEDLNSFNDNKRNKYFLKIKAGFYTVPNGMLSFMAIRDRSNIARKMAKEQQTTNLFAYGVFDEAVFLRQTKEREFENMMEQSLQNREFKMYLQPKINIQTGKVAGAEALVRWESPIYGTIRPNSFIPMFERNGFIVQIDLNVFEQACEFLRERIDAGQDPVHISVNLSRAHLYNQDFMQDFIAIREQYDVPASLLEFEITESMAFEQLEFMEKFINKIHEAGFTCSIDDFGSGYSSLNALSYIPADVLKLDKTFFKIDSHQKIRNKQVITSVISLAKKLDMKVVAEGIETSSQAHFLQGIDCDIIQGFIYSRPLPVPAFENFLETWTEDIVSNVV